MSDWHSKFSDLTVTAIAVMAMSVLMVTLSTVTHFALETPWPQVAFLSEFKDPRIAFFVVILNPQPLFSPILVPLVVSMFPLVFHIVAFFLLHELLKPWQTKSKILYYCIVAVPVFGPFATQTLMKTLGDLVDD